MNNIQYLSLEGGGVKAYAYVGVLKYFAEHHISLSHLKVISGSSIGAFSALCITLQYDYSEFHEILSDLSLPNFVTFYTVCKALPNIFMKYGAVCTTPLVKLLDETLSRKKISTDITFQELYNKTNIDLILTGSNINTSETKYFNYKNTPNMKVKDACVISMSYPILFTPTRLNNDYYCDGGLYRNLPFEYVELEYDDEHFNTLGITLKEQSEVYYSSRNFIEYLLCLVNGLYNNSTWSDFKNDKYQTDKRICEILIPASISSFYVTEEQKTELETAGYNAIKNYMDSLNTPKSSMEEIEEELKSHILPLI